MSDQSSARTLELLRPSTQEEFPWNRMAYSNRVAYFMGQMADLAYEQDTEALVLGLSKHGLELVAKIDINDTQAFVAKGPTFAVLAFRGTESWKDALTDLWALPISRKRRTYHQGFVEAYSCVQQEVKKATQGLGVPLMVTGHSLGGALAILACSLTLNSSKIACCYTFGCPNSGDLSLDQQLVKFPIYRVVNWLDVVPRLPFWWRGTGDLSLLSRKGVLYKGESAHMLMSATYLILGYFSAFGVLFFLLAMLSVGDKLAPLQDHFMSNYLDKLRPLAQDRIGGAQVARDVRASKYIGIMYFLLAAVLPMMAIGLVFAGWYYWPY